MVLEAIVEKFIKPKMSLSTIPYAIWSVFFF